MSADRELLELAALAYWGDEIDDVCSIRWLEADQAIGYTHADNQDHNGLDQEFVWNPIDDDGDALRLANRLNITVDSIEDDRGGAVARCAYVIGSRNGVTECFGDHEDKDEATRRAITRAAAAIGATLPPKAE